MKKTAVILLLLIYGSATMGATVHLHYCMDRFVGWSLFHKKDDKCGKCGMAEKDKSGCCKDEHMRFKVKDDHQRSDVSQLIAFNTSPVLLVPVIDFAIYAYSATANDRTNCHVQPDIHRKRLHIFYSVFLI